MSSFDPHHDPTNRIDRGPVSEGTFYRPLGPARSFVVDTGAETAGPPEMGHVPDGSLRGARFGDYVIEEELARGGMGVVYRARQTSLDRPVALKTIVSSRFASDEEIQRFRVEAGAAAKLDHPGIVPVFEVGEVDGRHFYSMGLVEGGSLVDLVAEGPLPCRRAADLLRAIAISVRYAHNRNIVHRDLKPANVLLDRDGLPKVADFGLAKTVGEDSGLTHTGQVIGTPGYMPPEQAEGRLREVGPLADVYSLGALLYFLVTGRPPFRGESMVDTLRQVVDDEPRSPRDFNGRVDVDLETICLKCLEKDPGRRYASAAELVAELDRYLADQPITARRRGRLERVARWCRRRPVQAGLVAAVVVSLLLGGAGTGYFAIAMQREALDNAAIAKREADARATAVRAQRDAERKERQLLVETARLLTTVRHRNGWSWEGLESLAMARRIESDGQDDAEIRSLAARCLLARDVRLSGRIAGQFEIADMTFSADGERLLLGVLKKVPWCPLLEYDVHRRSLVADYGMSTFHVEYVSRLVDAEPFQDGFRAVAVDAAGEWVAGGTRFGRVLVWRRGDRRERVAKLSLFEHEVHQLLFGPDGRTLYASTKGSGDDELAILVLDDSGSSWRLDRRVPGVGRELALSPDGRILVHSSGERMGRIDTATGAQLPWPGPIGRAPSYSADGRFVAITQASYLKILDAETGIRIRRVELGGASMDGDRLHFPGAGDVIVGSNGDDDRVRFVDPVTGDVPVVVEAAGRDRPSFAVSPDGRTLAVAEHHGVALYEVRSPIASTRLRTTHRAVQSIEFDASGTSLVWVPRMSTDGRLIVSTTEIADGEERVLVAKEGIDDTAPPEVGPRVVRRAGSSGRVVFLDERDLSVFEPSSNGDPARVIGRVAAGFDGPIAASRDGRHVWAIVDRDDLHCWSTEPFERRYAFRHTLENVTSGRLRLHCLDGGTDFVAVGTAAGRILLLDADVELPLPLVIGGPGGEVGAVALSPSERFVFAGTDRGLVGAYRVENGERLGTSLAHGAAVEHLVAIGEDHVASAGRDGWIRVWRIDEHGWSCELELGPFDSPIREFRAAPGGRRVAWLLGDARTCHVLDLAALSRGFAEVGLSPFQFGGLR